MEHPYFQRLRRIKQLGLTHYVYPGANHTRFQHALGASYLMGMAIENIRNKGTEITDDEAQATIIAILLHDIGHGPFSHSLEHSIIEGITHEYLSLLLMQELNKEFNGQLDLAIKIFQNKYKKKFLYQLVSSQLDMDRMDYLRRDSFFTGVTEGTVGSSRIIKMLNVVDDQLVLEAKGIYSIEKFLIARRLMYWQVYLHKTVLAADALIVNLLRRLKYVSQSDNNLYASPALKHFLNHNYSGTDLEDSNHKTTLIHFFTLLDDADIMSSAKAWIDHKDKLLAYLSRSLLNRVLPSVRIQKEPFNEKHINELVIHAMNEHGWRLEEVKYLIFQSELTNSAYNINDDHIQILYNNGKLVDITEASDILNVSALNNDMKKYYLCFPKNCSI
ncbi:MAG: HD domain-containing protein [Bacteroidetes bacterium]|nr:HD domain-containing protein [Bacteroidota bacterium]